MYVHVCIYIYICTPNLRCCLIKLDRVPKGIFISRYDYCEDDFPYRYRQNLVLTAITQPLQLSHYAADSIFMIF